MTLPQKEQHGNTERGANTIHTIFRKQCYTSDWANAIRPYI